MNSRSLRFATLTGFLGLFLGATTSIAAVHYASHPFLHRAQKELYSARSVLARSTHDCGGHKVTALQDIDAAIKELDLAVAYADAHPQEDSNQSQQ
jgi:hypothetical protein